MSATRLHEPPSRDAHPESSTQPRPSRFPTKNDIPAKTRDRVVDLLNARLADALDLQSQCKQAHWNVKGPHFIALHQLFDKVYEAAGEYVDLIAERVVQLGGTAEGTVRRAAAASTLLEYPQGVVSGDEHVAVLSDTLAGFAHNVRQAIDAVDEMHDAITVDILTEIGRGTEQWLWFVEAHQQVPASQDSK